LIFLIIVGLFVFGVFRLLVLRFEEGDVYPAYSSLRSDPLGTKVLYDSLVNLKKNVIRRNYRPLHRFEPAGNTTFFFLGADMRHPELNDGGAIKKIEEIVSAGGRVVISFRPLNPGQSRHGRDTGKKKKGLSTDKTHETGEKDRQKRDESIKGDRSGHRRPAGGEKVEKADAAKKDDDTESIEESWGFTFKYESGDTATGNATPVRRELRGRKLPVVTWHTALYFEKLEADWKIIYKRNGHPVLIEKSFKGGTVVLSSDSYFFSNEALRKERHAGLLTWVIGKSAGLVFDESHLPPPGPIRMG